MGSCLRCHLYRVPAQSLTKSQAQAPRSVCCLCERRNVEKALLHPSPFVPQSNQSDSQQLHISSYPPQTSPVPLASILHLFCTHTLCHVTLWVLPQAWEGNAALPFDFGLAADVSRRDTYCGLQRACVIWACLLVPLPSPREEQAPAGLLVPRGQGMWNRPGPTLQPGTQPR